ncbi:TPA: hypothetical protein NIH27_001278 [Pseudomonas aeruginosa]|nr:hypothetical protein [Pseudomonas aeruginosa]
MIKNLLAATLIVVTLVAGTAQARAFAAPAVRATPVVRVTPPPRPAYTPAAPAVQRSTTATTSTQTSRPATSDTSSTVSNALTWGFIGAMLGSAFDDDDEKEEAK